MVKRKSAREKKNESGKKGRKKNENDVETKRWEVRKTEENNVARIVDERKERLYKNTHCNKTHHQTNIHHQTNVRVKTKSQTKPTYFTNPTSVTKPTLVTNDHTYDNPSSSPINSIYQPTSFAKQPSFNQTNVLHLSTSPDQCPSTNHLKERQNQRPSLPTTTT